jgi:hypothetical protein
MPSLLDASCCKLDVVNGGDGLRLVLDVFNSLIKYLAVPSSVL